MLRVLLTLGIGLPIFASLFVWYGFKERAIAQASSQTPETISLSNLIARGPEGNANIILTDYVPLKFHVVKRGKRGRWDGAWVPVVPKDAALAEGGDAPRAVRAVVYSDKGRTPEEIFQRLSSPQLPGMVSNRILTPDDDMKEKLEQQYPQTDFSTCVYIHEGREPASGARSALMIYGGSAAVLIGLGSLGLALVVWRKNAAEARRQKGRRRDEDYDDEEERPGKRRSRARDVDDEDAGPPRKRRYADEDEHDRPRRKRRAAEDDEDDDRPRRRSRRDDD